jgi:hypothetical protein
MGYPKDKQKEYNTLYYIKNKEETLLKQQLINNANQALKNHTVIGKSKEVKLPAETLATLHDRFRVDESSKTGLRWSESSINKPHCMGKEAGILTGSCNPALSYYYIELKIGGVKYRMGVARVIIMMVNNIIIDPGMCVNHINRNRKDNRIVNLEVTTTGLNNVNCVRKRFCSYKNVNIARSKPSTPFFACFRFLGKCYKTRPVASEDHALMLGWELITSGEVPLVYIKSQIDEWKDGTYLQRALAECKKQGIAVTPPKFKTLHEYIASVESEAA